MIPRGPRPYLMSAFIIAATLAGGFTGSSANELFLQPRAGFTLTTGDVSDLFAGGGAVLGGRVFVGMTDQFYLGGGGAFSLFAGKTDLGIDITDAAFQFSIDGGALFYILKKQDYTVRPYVAGFGGWGILGWSYSREFEQALGVDSDSNGFLYLAPEAGLNLGINEDVGVSVGARYLITRYGDTTREDFGWDASGGDFLEVFVTLDFVL